MTKLCVPAALALVLGAALFTHSASASQSSQRIGPDLSGRWQRQPAQGNTGSADSTRWGSSVEIDQSGSSLAVRPAAGRAERYRLDGTETAFVISMDGCTSTTRISKATVEPTRVVLTTWLVTKTGCLHGEDLDDPLVASTGPIEVDNVRGPRRLESITVLYRDGDTLTVETTARSTPGSEATTSTTTYRR